MTSPAGGASSIRRVPRRALSELAGGVGDWGLLLPIAVAMIAICGLNATAVFAGVGTLYIATALYFRVPFPVQPLKAFGAAAIALGLDATTVAAGALLMAAALAALAATGLAGWLTARFPIVLVRGIQAAVALLLVKAAIDLARSGGWEGSAAIDPLLSFGLAAACFALLVGARGRPLPASLLVLGAGAGVGLIAAGLPAGVALGPEPPSLSIPDRTAFAVALSALVIAQLPLTFGNSVVATCDAARSYFGERADRVRPNRVAASIAGGNLLAGLGGGLPVCHGAGGVTAHYSMGARSRWATASAGAILVALGLTLGGSLPALVTVLAPGALAGMLAYVGLEHALLAARLERTGDRLIAAAVGAVTLLAGNLAIGFAVGVAAVGARGVARRGLRRTALEPAG